MPSGNRWWYDRRQLHRGLPSTVEIIAFFAAFEYGFSPDELLFMRHAPERLVEMGAEPWFSNHGFEREAFEQLRAAANGLLELQVRVHREPRFEFLEPVVVELRLKVAHTLAFGGSRVLGAASETLRQVVERMPESRAAVHATAALGSTRRPMSWPNAASFQEAWTLSGSCDRPRPQRRISDRPRPAR